MSTEKHDQSTAATEGCAAADGYADGRPLWDELCDCATVCRTLRPKGKNESLEDFARRAEQTLRHAYEHGADWNYNADCPHCDTGRKHTHKLMDADLKSPLQEGRSSAFHAASCSPLLDLRLADCMAVMKEMPDNAYDLAIVDPPYGIGWDGENDTMSAGMRKDGTQRKMATWNNPKPKGYTKKSWDAETPPPEYFAELRRVSKRQIVWGGNYFTENLPPSGGWVTWEKGVPDGMSLSQCELAWTNCRNSVRHIRLLWAGYKKCEESERMHPTQKPVKLYDWLLANFAKPGDRILDTHMGSGSIAIACHYRGHPLTACEIDADYYAAAVERIQRETRQLSLFTENSVLNEPTSLK